MSLLSSQALINFFHLLTLPSHKTVQHAINSIIHESSNFSTPIYTARLCPSAVNSTFSVAASFFQHRETFWNWSAFFQLVCLSDRKNNYWKNDYVLFFLSNFIGYEMWKTESIIKKKISSEMTFKKHRNEFFPHFSCMQYWRGLRYSKHKLWVIWLNWLNIVTTR